MGGLGDEDLVNRVPWHANEANVSDMVPKWVEAIGRCFPHVVDEEVAERIKRGKGAVKHPAIFEVHP